MYNRYIPSSAPFVPLEPPSAAPSPPPQSPKSSKGSGAPSSHGFSLRTLLSSAGLPAEGAHSLSDLLRRFHLDDLDLGDVLLAAVLLLLILDEGDDLDVLITLGVMLLVSLSEP